VSIDPEEIAARAAIRALTRRDEAACVAALREAHAAAAYDRQLVAREAGALVERLRSRRRHASGVDRLMHEFSLSTAEGVALMCLAEALLRVPDRPTAERLIRDKIGRGDWAAHLGPGHSLFVNAAAWGLMLSGRLVAGHSENALGQALTRLLKRGGEPLVRRGMDFAMRLLGDQFVIGETIEAALERARPREAQGYRFSFDMLGEAALTEADAARYFASYEAAIAAIGRSAAGRGAVEGPGISVKLSALHPRYQRSQRTRVLRELGLRLRLLMRMAAEAGIGFNIDAEEADRLELSLDLFAEVARERELADWPGMGFVVQAYQKRAPAVIDWLGRLARQTNRRFMLRLVKGAYWDSEIKRAQVDGLVDYPVYTRKAHTDLAYLVCARKLIDGFDAFYPQFATHNAHTLAAVWQMARERGLADFEFQCLHGMGEPLYDPLVGPGGRRVACRIYAPVGTHATLLPYLVRRLLENGANSSFVNRLVDDRLSVAELIEEPADRIARDGAGSNPAIPLPPQLFGTARRNSIGVDLTDETVLAELGESFDGMAREDWNAEPLVAGSEWVDGAGLPIVNPADRVETVGSVVEADRVLVEQALGNAVTAAGAWFARPAGERAAILRHAADLIEAMRPQLMSLCIREAGKTWPNAVGEVREAVDFCRYYAQQAELAASIASRSPAPAGATAAPGPADATTLPGPADVTTPPGPAVCISPWNFPLAIFVGQVAGALAAGCSVLAKPAEQAPLVAHFVTSLMHQAGVPVAVLQLLPGTGELIGAALVADRRVRRVLFTGSTAVARRINRQLAERPEAVLIAETGGQNAMLVDSSALPEQVVQDVLVSGFDSAGQRCSALRILCLQEEIADRVLAMLRAAMAELRVGNPAGLATDVGPVIDETAQRHLLAHIEAMRRLGFTITQSSVPEACRCGHFVPPTLIEIDSLGRLGEEVFGPVVHVLRFAAGGLEALVGEINGLGYGLTMGLHSRIDETHDAVVARARVGNLYINRNMVGAVVGVQPFGGEGLSGTGPKAGGPLYLARLAGRPQLSPAMLGISPMTAPVPLLRLRDWAVASGRPELAQLCADHAQTTLLGVALDLPGPTGESNRLRFEARGTVLCIAADEADWLAQLAAVFATGNRPAARALCRRPGLVGTLPAELANAIDWRDDDQLTGLAAVLADRHDVDLARRLASTPGPIVPVILPGSDRRHPLYRLVLERHLCINTAAAGGNAGLMASTG
jgi:RHH-type proline utilization regulon transcriptional repressor/proline dehydrogenase/delta 1-pyrroline-5-carboxylate dehydrogenase